MVTKVSRDSFDGAVRPITNIDINGGTIDGTTIGASTPDAGYFTTLQAASLTVTTALNVTGATVTGTIYAKYADLAEFYRADEVYEKGTLVRLGGNYEVTQTTDMNDIEVFGVISSDPAIILNSDDRIGYANFDLPVAFVGRVPCRVVGPVRKGQRLVSSAIPGVAMGFDPARKLGGPWAMVEYGVNPFFARSLVNDPRTNERLVEVTLVTLK